MVAASLWPSPPPAKQEIGPRHSYAEQAAVLEHHGRTPPPPKETGARSVEQNPPVHPRCSFLPAQKSGNCADDAGSCRRPKTEQGRHPPGVSNATSMHKAPRRWRRKTATLIAKARAPRVANSPAVCRTQAQQRMDRTQSRAASASRPDLQRGIDRQRQRLGLAGIFETKVMMAPNSPRWGDNAVIAPLTMPGNARGAVEVHQPVQGTRAQRSARLRRGRVACFQRQADGAHLQGKR